MVYIYKKKIADKQYYYLRASSREGDRVIAKDIAYLGNDIGEVRKEIFNLKKYAKEIRKAYRAINKFVESDYYLELAKQKKLRKNDLLEKVEEIEACRLHWEKYFRKLDKKTQEEILKGFLVGFAYNTTSIEGNTITLEEAYRLLYEEITPKNKTIREVYDIRNTERVFFGLEKYKDISLEMISEIHDELLRDIDERKGFRVHDIRVYKAKFSSSPGTYVLTDMKLLLKWYKENKKLHPLVLAVLFHHRFEKIHPFMDGNGRTGRMLMNFILIKNGYPPLIIPVKDRVEYLDCLASADEGDVKELISFVANKFVSGYWEVFI